METRDYLKKQIDMMGVVLAKLLARVTGAPDNFDISDYMIPEAPLPPGSTVPPLEEILKTPLQELPALLEVKYKFNYGHIWQYADILHTCADKIARIDTNRSQLMLVRSLCLYEHLLVSSKTLDLTLVQKVKTLKATLSYKQ